VNRKKTLLITGGTRGIGKAISMHFAKNTYKNIILNYLQNDKEAEITKKSIESFNAKCHLIKANLVSLNDIDEMFNQIHSTTKHINVFVHCAALNTFKPLSDIKPNQWDLTMNINSRGFLYCVQKCIPVMPTNSSIIAISSLGSQKVFPNYGALGPAKAAMECTIKYLAAELATKGIRVNGITAGMVDTDSIRHFPDYENLVQRIKQYSPAQRLGTPDDIAEVVGFLASPAAGYIYGQNIIVDGGQSLI
jgi:enoyl-[acyl-carrier protein] reductase III